MFNKSRLRLARERRGLTKRVLAEQTGLTVRSLSNFENQLDFSPSEETLRQIASVLNFPVSFFDGDSLDQPTPETASFRALKSMSAARQDVVLAIGAIGFALDEWLDVHFFQPQINLPKVVDEPPDSAALGLRHHWGLGHAPLKHLISLLEANGVRIYSLGNQPREVSAYSLWHDGVPYVFLNTTKTSEHLRFALAHELGHLTMHSGVYGNEIDVRQVEREADQFASAFLMPSHDVFSSVPASASRISLIRLKKRWGVSVMALTYRAHALGIITDWSYRMLCIEMSKHGDRTKEPSPMPFEQSKRLSQLFAQLREDGITNSQIASDLSVHADEIDTLTFGLIPTIIPGGITEPKRSRANLRLVK